MSKGEVDTPNQHKISMPAHENGTAMNNNDDHASSRTDNNNLYMTSASKVDALDAGAKFVLESKGSTHSCTRPKYSTVLSFTAVLSSAVTLLLLVKNLILQRACCPETLATAHVPLLLAEGIFWCPAGNWWHAGYHLTVSIAAPALLSLPFALDGLGWAPGFLVLTIATAVSFYAYTLISKVLEQTELEGHRFLRFRDLAGYVLGKESILQPHSQFFCTKVFVYIYLL